MAITNYTITGDDFLIQSQLGEFYQSGGVALVQWDLGYEPRYRPLSEWTSTHLVQVSWTGFYDSNYNLTGHSKFTSSGVTSVDTSGPLYLYIDFSNTSNYTPTMMNQVWMGQITDVLTLDGGNVIIDLNTASIRPMMGDMVGKTLIATDWNSWQPQAVPEPSYFASALLLFLTVILYKKYA